MVQTLETRTNRVVVARMQPGEDVIETIETVAKMHNIVAGQISLIGAIAGAKLGYFDLDTKSYKHFSVDEDVEVVSCMGNISMHEDSLVIHAHMIVADERGRCYGGHLLPGCKVSVTIELFITEVEGKLLRAKDSDTGLNLLALT